MYKNKLSVFYGTSFTIIIRVICGLLSLPDCPIRWKIPTCVITSPIHSNSMLFVCLKFPEVFCFQVRSGSDVKSDDVQSDDSDTQSLKYPQLPVITTSPWVRLVEKQNCGRKGQLTNFRFSVLFSTRSRISKKGLYYVQDKCKGVSFIHCPSTVESLRSRYVSV